MAKSQAYEAIRAAFQSGGVAAAIWRFLELFPDRTQASAERYIQAQDWA